MAAATTAEPISDLDIEEMVRRCASLLMPSRDDETTRIDEHTRRVLTMRQPAYKSLAEAVDAGGDEEVARNVDYVDTAHYVTHDVEGVRWQTARDVEAGEQVYTERPLAYVTLLRDTETAVLNEQPIRQLLPAVPERANTLDALFGDGESSGAPLAEHDMSLEWTLTYVLMSQSSTGDVRRNVSNMRRPGQYAEGHQLRAAMRRASDRRQRYQALRDRARDTSIKRPERRRAHKEARALIADVESDARMLEPTRRWISTIMRVTSRRAHDAPGTDESDRRDAPFSIDEILTIYATVAANLVHWRTPLSRIVYGVALYPAASHIRHACVPTCRASFGVDGHLVLRASGPLEAATPLSMDRVLVDPIFRCIQTAPRWLRDVADATLGHRCMCAECTATLNWMRATCAGNVDSRDGSVEGPPLDLSKAVDQQKMAAVIAAMQTTWSDPAEFAKGEPASSTLQRVRENPLMMMRMINTAVIIDELGAEELERELTRPIFTLSAYALAHMMTLAALTTPHALDHRFGCETAARLVALADEFRRTGANVLLRGKLSEQGADAATTQRRMFEWRAASLFSSFAATIMHPCLDAIDERLTSPTVTGREIYTVVDSAISDAARRRFKESFGMTAATYAVPTVERPLVPFHSTFAAMDEFKYESRYSRVVGMAIHCVDAVAVAE